MEERLGLLLESQGIIPRVYRRVARVLPDYSVVFTHSSSLLRKFPNTRWIPGGGVWIGGSYAGGSIGLFPKTRMTSMLTSNKRMTRLHRKRYTWARRLENSGLGVDVFRQAPGSTDTISVFETLRDYRYSIVMENFIDDRYFTEKVLNCFATGTVPIYLGAPLLSDFFNSLGYIPFRNWRQLRYEVLPALSAEDYDSRRSAIEDNLQRVKEFRSIEDYIYLHYAHELPL